MGRSWLLAPLSVLGLTSACGSDGGPDASGASTTIEVGESLPPATTPVIVETIENVDYYGACGNEKLILGATTYSPLLPEELDALDVSIYAVALTQGLRVAPPGPGDDIGTLVVYGDGIARFESDSGRVTWLTTGERAYNWDC